MTVEEMRKVIEFECKKHPFTCTSNGGCPMFGRGIRCVIHKPNPDPEDVKTQYELLTGTEEVVTDNPVSHPSHYTHGGIECIDAMESAFGKEAVSHFCICNAFKYVFRHEHKNGKEDIEKAEWYLKKYKELKYSE